MYRMHELSSSPRPDSGRTARRAACGGFTLLELLTVITLIGLIAGIAVPRMLLAVEAISADGEERVLVQMVEQLKLYAYLRNDPHQLNFEAHTVYRHPYQTAIADFEHLWFPSQQITWNAKGFSNARILDYTMRGQEKQLVLP
jgi:prepilin-type N-terminal cleavage/methylation domain-containing protein